MDVTIFMKLLVYHRNKRGNNFATGQVDVVNNNDKKSNLINTCCTDILMTHFETSPRLQLKDFQYKILILKTELNHEHVHC